MKVIFGLGNPGFSYSLTRHNAGFLTLDAIASELGVDISRKEHNSFTALARYHDEKLLLVKPHSYMNLSGYPLVSVLNYYKVELSDVLVIFDDMSLPAGSFRLRKKGSSGGHKGMQSIIEQTGSEIISRLKIGIGAPIYPDAKDYVLGRFTKEEMPVMAKVFAIAKEAALFWAEHGISRAMNEYNAKIKEDLDQSNDVK